LRCTLPYAQEGLLRREAEKAGAALVEVAHGALVDVTLRLPDTAADAFVAGLNESGQGRIGWLKADAG
jgi:hypothetical protein